MLSALLSLFRWFWMSLKLFLVASSWNIACFRVLQKNIEHMVRKSKEIEQRFSFGFCSSSHCNDLYRFRIYQSSHYRYRILQTERPRILRFCTFLDLFPSVNISRRCRFHNHIHCLCAQRQWIKIIESLRHTHSDNVLDCESRYADHCDRQAAINEDYSSTWNEPTRDENDGREKCIPKVVAF